MYKILISAYGCEPDKGSEQGVGWNWVLEMSKNAELWVITRANNREAIQRSLHGDLRRRIHFIYFDLPQPWAWIKHRKGGLYVYYAFWQWGVYKYAKELIGSVHFDYCQHLSFGSMWMPTFMHMLPIPFIWGPIGGGEKIPNNFMSTLPWLSRIPQYLRRLLIRFAHFNPFIKGPARAACAIIARTEDSKVVFPEEYQHKIHIMLETGMSDKMLAQYLPSAFREPSEYFELVYTGRLIALKNVGMAIRALALARKQHKFVRLTIVGNGPLKGSLMRLARKLGVHSSVHFAGAVSQSEVIKILQKSDIFIFPSLKEGGTWSLMEAMAVGLPVVCLDTSGMHIISDDNSAIRIKVTTPEDATKEMADAITLLTSSPDLCARMGKFGRERIQDKFLWSVKGEFMLDLLNGLDERQALFGVS